MSNFFEEVKRRKVYRVAVAYVVVAGGTIQLASAAFPAWELPNWALRLVIVLLLIGFPIALILAWAFDVTPEGIRATSKLDPARPSHRRRNIFILLAAGLLISATAGFFLLPPASANKLDKSIAVLPFENFSDEKDNAFFADGIQDDILTNLAKISDLKVISRTSVMPYRGKEKNVREIAKALGVSTILEGSVRKDKNRVRVNVQLINATNDQHIWAEDYDRDLTDVFAIQTDLAQKIASELQAKLSPSEKAQLTRKPTQNGEAYLAFVKARELQSNIEDWAKLKQAEEPYERAVQLDPNFALALADYSRLESWIYHTFDPSPGPRDKARTLATRALQLQPDLPEAHLALGFSYYYGDRNFDAALSEFETARRGLPNEMEAYLALGAIKRRQGRWNESNADLEKAATLAPKESWALQNLALNYEMLRDFKKANEVIDRALAISPHSVGLWGIKCKLAIEDRGDFTVAERALEKFKQMPDSVKMLHYAVEEQGTLLLLQRKFAEALQFAQNTPDESLIDHPDGLTAKYMLIGSANKGLGNEPAARVGFEKAKDAARKLVAAAPNEAGLHARLALALAFLGEKDAAVVEARQAMDLAPESRDTFDGPVMTETLAAVYATTGEYDRAMELLDGLLSRPSPVTVQMLKLDPVWDPLRKHPRFADLLTQRSAKT
jgi:TolB-like protein/Flp pilus assembly protein TadD